MAEEKARSLDDLFKALNEVIKKNEINTKVEGKNIDYEKFSKSSYEEFSLNKKMLECEKMTKRILADDKTLDMIVSFAEAMNKTLHLSMKRENNEMNTILIVKMIAYALAMLNKEKVIELNIK